MLSRHLDRYTILDKLSPLPGGTLYAAAETDNREVRVCLFVVDPAIARATPNLPEHLAATIAERSAEPTAGLSPVLRWLPGTEDRPHVIVLAALPDATWDTLARRGAITSDAARRWARALLDTLHTIHGHGRIHGRIDGEHVRVELGGELVLVESGLSEALLRAGASGLARTTLGCPERPLDAPATVHDDLYALGRLLYSAFARRAIPEGTAPVAPLREVQPHLPADLLTLVDALTHAVPEERPQSAEAARALLDNTPYDTPSAPEPTTPRPAAAASHRPTALILGLGLAWLGAMVSCIGVTTAFFTVDDFSDEPDYDIVQEAVGSQRAPVDPLPTELAGSEDDAVQDLVGKSVDEALEAVKPLVRAEVEITVFTDDPPTGTRVLEALASRGFTHPDNEVLDSPNDNFNIKASPESLQTLTAVEAIVRTTVGQPLKPMPDAAFDQDLFINLPMCSLPGDLRPSTCSGATTPPPLDAGTRVRIVEVHPEDAYYDDRAKLEGVICTAGGDPNPAPDGWVGGPFRCDNGQEPYFYRVMVERLGDAPATPPTAQEQQEGDRWRIVDVHKDDGYYGSRERMIGLVCTIESPNVHGDGTVGGQFRCNNGQEPYFYKAMVVAE